jgi:prevent-host-death family protein
MERIGVRELRQQASRWLKRVEAGECFEVTDRGRPIAVLAPLDEAQSELDRLLRSGALLSPAGAWIEPQPRPAPRSTPASEVLDDLRGEGE